MDAWNQTGSCCEGTMRYPVGWVQDCDWCVMAYVNNMLCEKYHVSICYVLTWFAWR